MEIQKQQSAHQKNSSEATSICDEVLDELYANRDAYAAEHGHDLERIYQDLKRREAASNMTKTNFRPVVSA
jgi:DNA-directed RNA polymerase sigma subunit (sigma70/sigma32)